MDLSGIKGINIFQIIKWSIIQMVFRIPDYIVYYSDHGLNNEHYWVSLA